jgi:hypothetical protein
MAYGKLELLLPLTDLCSCSAEHNIEICKLLLTSKERWDNFILQKWHHKSNMEDKMKREKAMKMIKEKKKGSEG